MTPLAELAFGAARPVQPRHPRHARRHRAARGTDAPQTLAFPCRARHPAVFSRVALQWPRPGGELDAQNQPRGRATRLSNPPRPYLFLDFELFRAEFPP